jgi:hypothetical protein
VRDVFERKGDNLFLKSVNNSQPRPSGRAVAGMKKGRGRRKMEASPSELKTGHPLVPQSPFVNMAGDTFSGSSDCCPAAGGEHV